jgi:uncharacterized membrane protein
VTTTARVWKIVRWAALAVAIVLALIQVIPADRTNPPVRIDVDAPDHVKEILRRACYDCHSHETHWPWYSRVAPVSWWIADHVEHGRGDLNFSEWPALDFYAQELACKDIEEQITKGEMPLRNYTILHPEARLTDDERETILEWARSGF